MEKDSMKHKSFELAVGRGRVRITITHKVLGYLILWMLASITLLAWGRRVLDLVG
jgi:hypothetical protein